MDRFRHLSLVVVAVAALAATGGALTSCGSATSLTPFSKTTVASVQHETASGQAAAAQLLIPAQALPNGEEAWATLDLSAPDGSLVRAYAVADTAFYERGPNDDDYAPVDARSEGFVGYSNWAGGGACPAEFDYDVYDSNGTKVNVLTQVRFFMAGE